jgi:hypothetical protein|tara:strand:+ start:889 stop:1434 length:546 start_codon:yes stop_codon:yes gene_type:complete
MNRLHGMRTYLAGAMDRVPDGGVGWRQRIKPVLKSKGVVVLDPCDKPSEVGIEDSCTRESIERLKKEGKFQQVRDDYAVIRTFDLRCVDISDFIIASIDTDVHACGTYEEVSLANSQKKPILIWCQQGKQNAPSWLFFMLPHQHIFGSMDELIEYLEHIDSSEKQVKHLKRWFFFDQERLK